MKSCDTHQCNRINGIIQWRRYLRGCYYGENEARHFKQAQYAIARLDWRGVENALKKSLCQRKIGTSLQGKTQGKIQGKIQHTNAHWKVNATKSITSQRLLTHSRITPCKQRTFQTHSAWWKKHPSKKKGKRQENKFNKGPGGRKLFIFSGIQPLI